MISLTVEVHAEPWMPLTITYTVTVRQVGAAAVEASWRDDLSAVLDDATMPGVAILIVSLLAVLLLVTLVPELVLFLPNLVFG
jgi:hypothetical protein